jgi:hypothetical protein
MNRRVVPSVTIIFLLHLYHVTIGKFVFLKVEYEAKYNPKYKVIFK